MSVCMENRRSRWAVLAAGCGLWTGEHATPTGSSEEPEERSLSYFDVRNLSFINTTTCLNRSAGSKRRIDWAVYYP